MLNEDEEAANDLPWYGVVTVGGSGAGPLPPSLQAAFPPAPPPARVGVASHMRMVLSEEAVARRLASGLQTSPRMSSECPGGGEEKCEEGEEGEVEG